jgi:hypothetical protein
MNFQKLKNYFFFFFSVLKINLYKKYILKNGKIIEFIFIIMFKVRNFNIVKKKKIIFPIFY